MVLVMSDMGLSARVGSGVWVVGMETKEEKSKRCSKCGEVKLLEEFYRCRGMKNGRQNKCIECAKRDQREGTVFPERCCVYCGADISRLNWKRTTCNSPECRERWQGELTGRKREYEAGWRERRQWKTLVGKKKGVRLCRVCKDRILNGNWLFCETCYEIIQGSEVRLDEGYLFC